MKTSLGLNRRRRGRPKIWGAVAVVLICLVLVVGGSWFAPLSRAGLFLASPVIRAGGRLSGSLNSLTSGFRLKRSLLSQNLQLQERVAELEAELIDHQELETDNRLLREELGIKSSHPELQIVPIVSHPWNAPFDVILVELPDPQKVLSGDPATFKSNVWVGWVAEVLGRFAKVRLLSTPGTSVPVLIGENGISGLAEGKGNGNLALSLPRSLEIKEGDLVRAASSTVPLMIGTVGAVEKDEGESLQTVLVRTPINLSFIRYLEINGR